MIDWFKGLDQTSGTIPLTQALLAMLASAFLSTLLGVVYLKVNPNKGYGRSLVLTQVTLSVVIASVLMVIGDSIAVAFGAFGILGLVLSSTGIYGVMAYAVSRRTREIGIRMAIGATRGQVLSSVARSAATLIGAGLVLALGLALGAGRLLERILYGVKPSDPLTFAIVFTIMLGVGAAATFLPARRATRIDPMQALRLE